MGKTNFRRMMMLREHDKTVSRSVTALRKSVTAGNVSWNAVCASWKVATTAIPTIRRRKTATSTPTLSPATLT